MMRRIENVVIAAGAVCAIYLITLWLIDVVRQTT